MTRISANITLAEAIKSQSATRHGIDNTPTAEHLQAMRVLAEKIFEPIRAWHGKPIGISSFYRSPKLNKKIGGSTTSQHCLGEAMDIDADIFDNGVTNKQIFDFILANLDFDQLLWEHGTRTNPDWVHVSFTTKRKNRKQVLIVLKEGNKTVYLPYNQTNLNKLK
jgi:zinc D-Ala-D-Ala carboxypeptidase